MRKCIDIKCKMKYSINHSILIELLGIAFGRRECYENGSKQSNKHVYDVLLL